ncbi:hypothetical protein [Neolewinella antarctica]|uniref:LytTR family transcriptional regulator n=1 Tax=Neolewinella antarctica TaxID=442734 RepID=A0ABX0XE01_9BACT|nr:hypothetical protein [Neolewinella antarctica]NJC27033.1 hypothetical protein [Neolewinella antarctica]
MKTFFRFLWDLARTLSFLIVVLFLALAIFLFYNPALLRGQQDDTPFPAMSGVDYVASSEDAVSANFGNTFKEEQPSRIEITLANGIAYFKPDMIISVEDDTLTYLTEAGVKNFVINRYQLAPIYAACEKIERLQFVKGKNCVLNCRYLISITSKPIRAGNYAYNYYVEMESGRVIKTSKKVQQTLKRIMAGKQ